MPYFLCLWTVVCLERSRTLKINCIYKVKKLSARDIALIGMCDDLQYLSVYVKYSLKIGFWLLMKERTSTTSPKIETGCKTDIYWYFCQKRIKMSQKWLSFPSKAKFNHAANKQTPSSLLGYFQTKFSIFKADGSFTEKLGIQIRYTVVILLKYLLIKYVYFLYDFPKYTDTCYYMHPYLIIPWHCKFVLPQVSLLSKYLSF